MRCAYSYAFVFFCLSGGLAACGEPPVEVAPKVVLHELDDTPSCFDKPELETVDVPEDVLKAAAERRERLKAQIELAFYEADVLSGPIRDAPDAVEWSGELEDGGTLEGHALARGEEWSVIKVIAIFGDANGERTSRDVEIDVSPRRTLYDFGDR